MTTITAELGSSTTVQLSNGRHSWTADEPPESGGQDQGPTPYELLVASLAACTCITLYLYCQHKEIELTGVSARYEFDRVHADDCADCDDDRKGFIDRITSHVRIEGDFDPAQRNRLEEIVGRCPVHKTLANGVHMVDDVEFA